MSLPVYLMPHAVCWRQDPRLVWTMAAANAVTFISYAIICGTLLYLARKTRRVIARDWAYFVVGFALFIVACGSTHLMEVVTTWVSVFWIDAWTNIVTAVLSAYVMVQFMRRVAFIGYGINDYAERLSQTELEKARMLEALLAAQKLEEWSRMSAVVSHEISNPLESIQNMLYLVQADPTATPAIVELVEQTAAEVGRVIAITQSTLSYFRQSAVPEPTDLRSSAESIRHLLEPVFRMRQLQFTITSEGDTTVKAFAGETRQVLLNLVRNACEASTQSGANVSLTLQGVPDGVKVSVKDEGTGIPPEVRSSLFQFGVSTKGERGNGLGLWAVKHIVDRHAGTIEIETAPGCGTQFHIWWPRQCAPPGGGANQVQPLSLLQQTAHFAQT